MKFLFKNTEESTHIEEYSLNKQYTNFVELHDDKIQEEKYEISENLDVDSQENKKPSKELNNFVSKNILIPVNGLRLIQY